jgi:putative ABC transport system permease protein
VFLAVRELRAARGRFTLVAGVIGLIAILSTLLTGLAIGLVDDGVSGLRALPLTHLAFQPGAESSFSRSTLRPDHLRPWDHAQDVESAPLGVSFFNAETTGGDTLDIAMFGSTPGGFLLSAEWGGDGLATEGSVVLSSVYESREVQVGDVVTIAGPERQLRVIGFTDAGSYGHVPIAFTSLSTWQHLVYGDARDLISAIAIRTDRRDLAVIDRAAGTETDTKSTAYRGSPGFTAETATMTLIRGSLLAISALVVGAFFTVWTVQRTRQIGLMKALGASNAYVIRDAVAQVTVVLVGATALGAAVAVGVGQLIHAAVPFRLEPIPVLASSVLLVALGIGGCLTTIRKIIWIEPIIALTADH